MLTSKIKVLNEEKIANIISDLERGKLKIPRFQRQFVWERSKIIKLLDSIYQEFPIGSFFIWEADRQYSKFFKDIAELELPKPQKYSMLDFILDGQQRVTSLYVVMKGKKVGNIDYKQICFDIQSEKFVIRRRKFKLGDYIIPVYELFGDDHLSIFASLDPEKQKIFNKCVNIFTNYPLSIIKVTEKELSDAIEIFERINQGGKRLGIFDLVVASTWGDDFDLRQNYEELEKFLIEKGFGRISPEVVLHAASLIVKNYCRKQYLLQLTRDDLKDIWPDIEDAFKLAVDYLSANLGVKIYEFAPYPAMISLLTYLFYKIKGHSISSKNAELVHQWFWQSALGERYTRSRETTMEEDRKKFFDKLLAGEEVRIKYPIDLSIERLKELSVGTKSAIRNAFFCMLALRQPKHFKNNNNIVLDYKFCSDFNNKELHHIFPRAFLRQNKVAKASRNALMNFCFIPAELNKEISKSSPADYFKEFSQINPEFKDTLKSHLIPTGNFIDNNDYDQFIETRTNLVLSEFENLCNTKIARLMSSDNNKAVDKVEDKIREIIDHVLSKKEGSDYWNKFVPRDIIDVVNKKVDGYLRKNPDVSLTSLNGRKLLDFCDVMDYCKMILVNWNLFEKHFGAKSEIEKKFVNLKEYRNAIKHNREMDSVLRKEGEAAVEWFDKTIK